MAKGQVSEEQLSQGLKGIGNFGGLSTSRVRRDNPFRDSRKEVSQPEPAKPVPAIEPAPLRVREAELKPVPAKTVRTPPAPKPPPKAAKQKTLKKEDGARKADIFTVKVTLPISPEMEDEVERLARELQRTKTSKQERITANTVMRVAIRLLTSQLELRPDQAPNTEEELFQFATASLSRKGG
jgi:hypothetical protein